VRPISGVSQLTKRSGITSDLDIRSGITSDDPSSFNERGEDSSRLSNINQKQIEVAIQGIEDEESYDFDKALREKEMEN
jgi:hypothetical protein